MSYRRKEWGHSHLDGKAATVPVKGDGRPKHFTNKTPLYTIPSRAPHGRAWADSG